MLCKSCKEDIPSKFTHALSRNECPLCGAEIIDDKLKDIISNLKLVLSDASEYMNEIEDWLFSNFSFKKIHPGQVVLDKEQFEKLSAQSIQRQFVPGQGRGAIVNRNDDQDSQDMSGFSKRAGVVGNHKKALDFIKGRPTLGAAHPSEFKGVDDEYGDINEDNLPPLNQNEAQQMDSIFANSGGESSHELELQKLKRLYNQNAGNGTFRRE